MDKHSKVLAKKSKTTKKATKTTKGTNHGLFFSFCILFLFVGLMIVFAFDKPQAAISPAFTAPLSIVKLDQAVQDHALGIQGYEWGGLDTDINITAESPKTLELSNHIYDLSLAIN